MGTENPGCEADHWPLVLVPRWRIRGAINPHPNEPSWLHKYEDNVSFAPYREGGFKVTPIQNLCAKLTRVMICICWRFGTHCSIFIGGVSSLTSLMKMEQSVPKRRHINDDGVSSKRNNYNSQNTTKIWNQGSFAYFSLFDWSPWWDGWDSERVWK